ncbi:chorismate-binding protein [Chryseobacterium sp. MP_3.2]|uniref:chorismate-binding protein n=1 Tax=Chryseobacterium sp. MP_3.2 TaxID=3071712 RepID=UPI002DFAB132|nr:isochorismate synthase [Chryseobacterium sp. MP_3.2]
MLYFRFPFSETILTTDFSSENTAVSFVPFDKETLLNFKGKTTEISREEFLAKPLTSSHIANTLLEFRAETADDYQNKIAEVIRFVKKNELPKLVISRKKILKYNGLEVNLSESFLNLCKAYANAFVYVFLQEGKCWMGAFSEVLGKFDKQTNSFETMSLAGTLPTNEQWTSKELEEQKTVTNFVAGILEKPAERIKISETKDHISGNIKHLRTDFKVQIKAENLDELISQLHPTPAVCGIPKEFCKNAIANFEDYNRKFYAGYIKVESENLVQYFVNLRCAEFLNNAAFLYVGGGITANSEPKKEWAETELKAEAVLNNIFFQEKISASK